MNNSNLNVKLQSAAQRGGEERGEGTYVFFPIPGEETSSLLCSLLCPPLVFPIHFHHGKAE